MRLTGTGTTLSLSQDASGAPAATAAEAGHTGRLDRGWRRAKREQRAFVESLRTQVPRVVFVLVPVYGLLLALAYRNRRRPLPVHMVFALHARAFVFLALALPQLAEAGFGKPAARRVDGAAALWLLAYFPLALRRAYGGRWSATLARTVAVGAMYGAVACGVGLAFILAMAWRFGAAS